MRIKIQLWMYRPSTTASGAQVCFLLSPFLARRDVGFHCPTDSWIRPEILLRASPPRPMIAAKQNLPLGPVAGQRAPEHISRKDHPDLSCRRSSALHRHRHVGQVLRGRRTTAGLISPAQPHEPADSQRVFFQADIIPRAPPTGMLQTHDAGNVVDPGPIDASWAVVGCDKLQEKEASG